MKTENQNFLLIFFTGVIVGITISFLINEFYFYQVSKNNILTNSIITRNTNYNENCKKNTTITIKKCNFLYANTLDELSIFDSRVRKNKVKLYKDKELIVDDILYGYDVLFELNTRFAASSWLGVQNQQNPSDAHLIQTIIWETKPDLIIDLGTNTGGSAVFFASIMNYYNQNGKVVTIDIKDFDKNWYSGSSLCKKCTNPSQTDLWQRYIKFYKGSTTDQMVLEKVNQYSQNASVVFVSVDASHEPLQVYNDLKAYATFVTIGSYIVVQDTKLDRLTRRSKSNSIHGFIDKFLDENSDFVMDRKIELLFYYTQHPKGFLKRIK